MAAPDITIDTGQRSRLKLADQINVLTMGASARRRLLRKMGKETRQHMRENIKKQRTVTGAPMAPRSGKSRRRMLRKMAKGTFTKILNDHSAVVTWKKSGQAQVASRHQHGVPEDFSAKKAERIYGKPNYSKPATPAQAKSLNREGFRRRSARKRGKGGAILKRMPQKWIRDNMSLGQAGLILRLMRTGTRKGAQRWQVKVPKRPILGATPADANRYLTAIAQDMLRQIKHV